MSFWKRAGCQKESKALEKSMVARIVQEPSLGLLTLILLEWKNQFGKSFI